MAQKSTEQAPRVVIVGAGLAGLVLSLALKKHCGITAAVYEQAPRFDDNVGGAIGLYANGLRVLRDISPDLLRRVRDSGYPYIYRRWMRHDGMQVAVAREDVLTKDPDLQSLGIRRWKLQKVLVELNDEEQISIHFGKRLKTMTEDAENLHPLQLLFEDGDVVEADFVFGADGIKSRVRASLFGETEVDYTGITCLMGAASIARPVRGICFPSSFTTKCHACFYPTGDQETIFQIFFPTSERPETWGALSRDEAVKECAELAERLAKDGWHPDFIEPLKQAQGVIRVGLRAREPLPVWTKGRCALLGDAAHPPVPYIGQGAMMALEDAGILALLLKKHCVTTEGTFRMDEISNVFALYEKIRIPRTTTILSASKSLGAMQQKRADSPFYNWRYEWSIWLKVKRYGTLPVMFEGSGYDYNTAVQ